MRGWTFAVLLLAACGPAPVRDLPDGGAGSGPAVEDVTPGLNEVEPDLCHAADFAQYLGQPASVLQGVPIGRAYRVVPHGGIITQEYSAGRVNFWLGRSGDIARIGCG